MNPAFHQSLPIKTMSNVVFSLISVIDQANGTIPVASAMQNFTLDTLGLAIFGKFAPLYSTSRHISKVLYRL